MPIKPPRICGCGFTVPATAQCQCEQRRSQERKARFDAKRPSARARGYTREWEAERATFLKSNPLCRRCPSPATIVDHIEPHRGNTRLFWNRANWQPLCVTCHSRTKQAEERRAARR